jgi:hypothetical protein
MVVKELMAVDYPFPDRAFANEVERLAFSSFCLRRVSVFGTLRSFLFQSGLVKSISFSKLISNTGYFPCIPFI